MKVGVIARAEDRGLGILTWEVVRNLAPERVLVIDMGELGRGFPAHLDRYPGATVVPWVDGQLVERTVRDWWDGLDVVYSAETFYDQRVVGWATLDGVATVLHVMPEFLAAGTVRPDQVWVPTPWLAEQVGPHRLVPVPVPTDRWDMVNGPFTIDGPLRVLHVAGHKTSADRNGTSTLLRALQLCHGRMDVRIIDQDSRIGHVGNPGPGVTVKVEGASRDYWEMYQDADVLVLPRRYGGLCLPVQEAAGAGLGVVLPDVPPNGWYPAHLVPARLGGRLPTPGGQLRIATVSPVALTRTLDQLAGNPELVSALKGRSVQWANGHSWTKLRGYWTESLWAATV